MTTLRRTGNAPYKIDDTQHKLLFDEDSGTTGSKRWHWLRIFNQDNAGYILSVEYRSEFEPEHCAVLELASLEALGEALYKYDPTKYALGLPARSGADLSKNSGRNRQLYEDLKGRWSSLVTQAAALLNLSKPQEPAAPAAEPAAAAAPPKGTPPRVITVSFTEETLTDLDALRGELSREDFVRLATEKFIQIKKL